MLLEDFADVFEMLVQQVLAVIFYHPFGENRAAAADDAGDAPRSERNVLHQNAGVDGHVVHALLGLLLNDLQHHVDVQILHAADAGESFVNRHSADGHRRGFDDRLANAGNIAAGGQIHHRVRAVPDGVLELLDLACNVRRGGGVADVGVHLAQRVDADAHGLQIGVMDVGGDDHAPAGDFVAHEIGFDFFALCDEFHLLGDPALTGVMHLRADAVAGAPRYPFLSHT